MADALMNDGGGHSEQSAFELVQNLFNDTDLDKSGFVDSTELAVMLK